MLADVKLQRVSRRKKNRYDWFFFVCYFPLNLLLAYWPIPFVFPFAPSIKEQYLSEWHTSSRPELWALFHLILAILIGLVVFWLAQRCYRPNRFIWLPVLLTLASTLIYWL